MNVEQRQAAADPNYAACTVITALWYCIVGTCVAILQMYIQRADLAKFVLPSCFYVTHRYRE